MIRPTVFTSAVLLIVSITLSICGVALMRTDQIEFGMIAWVIACLGTGEAVITLWQGCLRGGRRRSTE